MGAFFFRESRIMISNRRERGSLALVAACLLLCGAGTGGAQNHEPNPYRTVEGWAKMPPGRAWGSTSAVYPAPDGKSIWVAERCTENTCIGHDDLDSVFLFDASGNLVRSFGKGLIVWPHGIYVDQDGNLWVTDARGEGHRGHQVHEFSPEGKLLMSLGQAGVAGEGHDTFNQPSDVIVAPNGDIFVADGHGDDGNNRIVKFDKSGKFIKEWGKTGYGPGEFRDPHALAFDSQGRLFVGDRANSRIQVFDQDGKWLATWTQFGRPSGIYIDKNDWMYVADSESNATWSGHAGWKRGIRVGSAKDGFVQYFIPDPVVDQDKEGTSGAEGVAADADGNVYGAEVGPKALKKYVKK
jgi:DNA-binding beta-propeller fold protein YncE